MLEYEGGSPEGESRLSSTYRLSGEPTSVGAVTTAVEADAEGTRPKVATAGTTAPAEKEVGWGRVSLRVEESPSSD